MACIQKNCDEEFSGLEFNFDNLSLSRPTLLSAALSVSNPLDLKSTVITEKAPTKYHPELGISQIYWNI